MKRTLTFDELVKFGQSHNYTVLKDATNGINWHYNRECSVLGVCDTINEVFDAISRDINLKKNPSGERIKVIFNNG